MDQPLKRVCAWCGKDLAAREEYASEGHVTHGICSTCALQMTRSTPRSAGEVLSLINEPVFLIDDNGVVKGANKAAAAMLNKELPDIEDELGGDVFECSYAKEEEGCGKSVHCLTCSIRNTVMDTLRSGQGFDKVPAFQSIDTPEGPRIMRFIITTEKLGEKVLLRIDGARKGYSA